MVLQAHPYLWNMEFLHFRFASYPEHVVHAVFHSEFVYFVFTIIDNIEYIDIRTQSQRTI